MIKPASASARDIGPHTIESLSILFVLIEALVHHVPKESTGLRNAEADRSANHRSIATGHNRWIVLDKRCHVPYRSEAEPYGHSSCRSINDFINLTWFTPSIHFDRVFIHETPACAWDLPPRRTWRSMNIESVGTVGFVSNWIRNVIAICQRESGNRGVWHNLGSHNTRDIRKHWHP